MLASTVIPDRRGRSFSVCATPTAVPGVVLCGDEKRYILQNKAKKFPVLNDLRILHGSKSMFFGLKERHSAVMWPSQSVVCANTLTLLWPRLDSEIKPGEEEA